jgi:hypothetical protein
MEDSMKRLLLLCAVLAVMLCATVYEVAAFQAFGKAEIGSMMEVGGKAGFSVSAGTNAVLLTDPVKNVRVMQFLGIVHADHPEQVDGTSSFVLIEKYIPLRSIQPYVTLGTGFVWQPKDTTADLVELDLKAEVGMHLYKWASIGFGVNYMPVDGPNRVNPYFSLNLISVLE